MCLIARSRWPIRYSLHVLVVITLLVLNGVLLSVQATPTSAASDSYDQVHLAWVADPSTTLTVVWRTQSTQTPSVVQYRAQGTTVWSTASGALRPSGTTGTLHEVTLRSLTPSTTYEYMVQGDGGVWSGVLKTRTAPRPGPADFDAIYVADTGLVGRTDGLATGTQQVINEIAALNPLLLLPGGDYAYYDSDKRYGTLDNTIDAWFNQMQPVTSQSVMMPTYGNHEALLGEGYEPWASRFPTPNGFDSRRNYSFDVGDVHFVSIFAVLNSTGLTSAQLQWIEQDITAAKAAGKRWIIPYFHVAPFADGKNHSSNLALRNQLGPRFERLGVKLVLTSHDQAYERTYPLTDVPTTNTPTSTSLRCYTMADGVTWAKISPGGKLSNISRNFSPFATNPPPAWTAYRDNTMHHFARLRVFASGTIQLDTYGVKGDGTPPVIQDTFRYTTGSCGPELRFDATNTSFMVTQGESASRTIHLNTSNGVATSYSVSDNATWLTATPASGMTPANLAVNVDSSGLNPGVYQATVTASAPGFAPAVVPVNLTVSSGTTGYTAMVSSASNRSNAVPLANRTVSGNMYVFTVPETDVVRVRFYLDDPTMSRAPRRAETSAPYDFAGGTTTTASPFNTATITNGSHTITAAIDKVGGGVEIIHATFTVNNTTDTTAPTVASTSPADGATNMAVGSSVSSTFSEAMDSATLTASTFTLVKQGTTAPIAANVSYDAATTRAILDPNADLNPSTTYVATITTGAKDTAGNALATAESWSFTTAGTVDTTAPTVANTSPADGATNVAGGSAVAATFSEAMDPATLTASTFTLVKQGTTSPIAASVSYDAATTRATLDPNADLSPSTTYVATITTGAKDTAGNALATAKSWSFTTAAATTTSPYSVQVSSAADRSNPVLLDGRTVSGNIYVFTLPESGVRQVSFYLDDPTMARPPRTIEGNAPYDFAGGSVTTALPFNTATIPNGTHTITAAVAKSGGGVEVVHASFIVSN